MSFFFTADSIHKNPIKNPHPINIPDRPIQHTRIAAAEQLVVIVVDRIRVAEAPHRVARRRIHQAAVAAGRRDLRASERDNGQSNSVINDRTHKRASTFDCDFLCYATARTCTTAIVSTATSSIVVVVVVRVSVIAAVVAVFVVVVVDGICVCAVCMQRRLITQLCSVFALGAHACVEAQ